MSSHFRWYPAESEVVVPWNARYSFPSQANKAIKMTPRIPPKNASVFSPGNYIRLEFPAQGYVNPGKTTLEFDVQLLYSPTATEQCEVRFQNNIQSIFSRVRLLYGSTPLEDIPNYNVIVRALTEWTGSDALGPDQTSITDGIGGTHPTVSGAVRTNGVAPSAFGTGSGQAIIGNVRQKYIHGIDTRGNANDVDGFTGFGAVPNGQTAVTITGTNAVAMLRTNPIRRYQVQLALGMLTQEKLIPTKFMASQLAIELTLAQPEDCIIFRSSESAPAVNPKYEVSNVNLIPEILEFDASYDESFLRGLQNGGVPIKFATWNNFRFSSAANTNFNLQIQERSRSVKAIFALNRRQNGTFVNDNGASFFTTAPAPASALGTTLQDFQFRIGGRYFPAAPVQNSLGTATATPNGGAESYVELAKALNILGATTLSTSVAAHKWAMTSYAGDFATNTVGNILPEHDYKYALLGYRQGGVPVVKEISSATSAASGDLPSCCFAIATDLETSNGLEISGLNAEEQSDISLLVRYSDNQEAGMGWDVFTYIDTMIVLRENNVLELIQ